MPATVASANGTWMLNIRPNAITKLVAASAHSGPNANSNWMDLMSELAREMTSPLATRS